MRQAPINCSDPLASYGVTALLHTLDQVVALRLLDLGIANSSSNGRPDEGPCQCLVVAFKRTAQGATCSDDGCGLADMALANTAGLGAALGLIIGIPTWQSATDLQRSLQRNGVAGGDCQDKKTTTKTRQNSAIHLLCSPKSKGDTAPA